MSFDEQPDDPNPHGECAAEIARLNAELEEQCRLLGISGSKEARLLAQLEAARRVSLALRESLTKMLRHFEAQHGLLLQIGAPDFVVLRDEAVNAIKGFDQ